MDSYSVSLLTLEQPEPLTPSCRAPPGPLPQPVPDRALTSSRESLVPVWDHFGGEGPEELNKFGLARRLEFPLCWLFACETCLAPLLPRKESFYEL